MVARVVPQSARRRHAESRKPDLRGVVAGGRWPVLNRLLPLANWLPAARLALALATARYTRCPDPLTPALALVFQCYLGCRSS